MNRDSYCDEKRIPRGPAVAARPSRAEPARPARPSPRSRSRDHAHPGPRALAATSRRRPACPRRMAAPDRAIDQPRARLRARRSDGPGKAHRGTDRPVHVAALVQPAARFRPGLQHRRPDRRPLRRAVQRSRELCPHDHRHGVRAGLDPSRLPARAHGRRLCAWRTGNRSPATPAAEDPAQPRDADGRLDRLGGGTAGPGPVRVPMERPPSVPAGQPDPQQPDGESQVTAIDLAYFNFEHGGLIGGGARGGGSGYEYTGLVRVMGEDDRWPNLFVMGEGDRYDFNGGEGMWGAVAAMRAAG